MVTGQYRTNAEKFIVIAFDVGVINEYVE